MVLLFLTTRNVGDMTAEAWRLSPHAIHLLKIYSAEQTQDAELTGQKKVLGSKPVVKSHSAPSFRHFALLLTCRSKV